MFCSVLKKIEPKWVSLNLKVIFKSYIQNKKNEVVRLYIYNIKSEKAHRSIKSRKSSTCFYVKTRYNLFPNPKSLLSNRICTRLTFSNFSAYTSVSHNTYNIMFVDSKITKISLARFQRTGTKLKSFRNTPRQETKEKENKWIILKLNLKSRTLSVDRRERWFATAAPASAVESRAQPLLILSRQ